MYGLYYAEVAYGLLPLLTSVVQSIIVTRPIILGSNPQTSVVLSSDPGIIYL